MLTKLDTMILPSPECEGPVGIEAFSGFFSARVVFLIPPGAAVLAAVRRPRPRPPVALRRSPRMSSRDCESLSGMMTAVLTKTKIYRLGQATRRL